MMMEIHEAVDGIEFAVYEVDQELTSHIPEIKKRKCTPRVMEEVDSLLDTRNYLISIAAEIATEQVEV